MNSIQRAWYSWKHGRKFAAKGKRCRFPFPDLTIDGHVEIGDMCRFRNNVTLRTRGAGRIVMGSRSGFSWNCVAEATSLIKIGNRTGIAENTLLRDTVIGLYGNGYIPGEAPREGRPILIEDDCFIGSGCYIGPGVTIGEGAVIAHFSVVTQDVPPYEIWGGRPARRISHRVEGVPEAVRREVEALIAQYGVQADRNAGDYEYK